MDVKVSKKDNWQRSVDVLVPVEELKPEFEKAYKKYQKKAKIHGFRTGKVPVQIIKRMFGPKIEVEVVENILPQLVTQAWQKENLRVVSLPKVENLDYQPGSDLKITFSVDVEPEFEITNYENFNFDRQIYEVSDQDVEQALKELQEEHALWETTEGPIEEDHHVLLDIQELNEASLPIVGHKYEGQLIALKDEQGNVTEIGKQLLGGKLDEKRVILVTQASEDRPAEAPKSVRVEATIKEIKRKITPELDDEFAKDVGEYETLDELKASLREQIQKNMQQSFEQALHHDIIDEIIKSNPFELPRSMVDQYLDSLIKQVKASSKDHQNQIDEQGIRQEYRPSAIWNIKWRLIRNKLAELHEIKVSEDEIREKVEKLADSQGQDSQRIWNRIKNDEDSIKRFRHDLLEEKVLDFLTQRQKLKEKTVRRSDLLEKKKIVEAY